MRIESLRQDRYYRITFLLGMVASILWVIFVNAKPFSDFQYYYTLAKNISEGLPWGDTYTSVGYSIILGSIFKIFGASVLKAKTFNLILTAVNYLCFLSILEKMDIKEVERKILFALFVFMPSNIFYNSILATEIIFTTILLLITNLYFSKIKHKYILIGVLTGLNTMVKPFFIAFAFAVFLVDFIVEKRFTKAIKNSMVILISCTIVISPWIYRNTKLVGQFTYVSNNGGIVLYINNNSQNKSGRWMAAGDVENSVVNTEEYKNANATEKNKMLGTEAKKWIKNHPKEFVELGFKRLTNTYFWGDDFLYSTYGSGISEYKKAMLFSITNNIRNLIFIPGIIYILIYSIIILKELVTNRRDYINRYDLYNTVLFYMFTGIYFITEGQGRYAFPEIFIMIYCFYRFLATAVKKYKEIRT
ncbi:hypothetical protein P8V03_07525 [Clostridium sp. A1-XYC3]|uniref:Glycosyltransferase RgtA/B/C/D-like domain-containing protein n=1 Tax=Clostridium tanneri TaxID=3037988 RepID=A0ABU4JSB3_9CLOT|nr:hypothetical protein [Clostridium sp. A1-XYC3]MDW8801003.1 hypothetical protein [Clostridium sp. A1-XYC3]